MRPCLLVFHAAAVLSLGAALVIGSSAAAAQTVDASCSTGATRPAPPRARELAALAQREHAAWGGAALDAQGRLLDAGSYEAEDTPRSLRVAPPWQRVMGYWEAVDPDGRIPSQVRFGALRPADRRLLQQALQQASASHLQGLGVGPDQGLSSAELRALQTAIDRVAVVDTPWSAAFISWLAREAGLQAAEFAFSEAHADYAGAAWAATRREQAGQPTPYALRACDLTRTAPRVGDLVCQARGSEAELDTFAKLGEALAQRDAGGGALPMHCDVVTQVDPQGLDAIGGNVLQSVTLRRLDFAPGTRRLDPSYLPAGCVAGTPGCVDRHMSRQPWSLLLQWR
ncbi:MAG: DUF2272 domain-containing protein [Bordetella sp.]|nr:DUF2272 domain-containing protein [Pseudomonadota bacterium]